MDEVRYLNAGEQGLVVEFGKEIEDNLKKTMSIKRTKISESVKKYMDELINQ